MSDSIPSESIGGNGRYTLERLLGRGGMGAVYLARDHESGEHVALKKLLHVDAQSVLRLKREFRAVADLNHPNLIKLYDLELAGDGWMLTMEHVAGQDLLSYVDDLGAWDDEDDPRLSQRALSAFHQVACGVRALHCAGMLHRDLKPSNVLVSERRVVVLDFGLVRALDAGPMTLTDAGAITGTPAYMAPEQALGRGLSEASDWYAFGVMLYEALTGRLPIEGSIMELLMRKLQEDPEPPEQLNPSVPASLGRFCMALLQRDPAKRPSGEAVLARLEAEGGRPHASIDPARRTDTDLQPMPAFFGRKAELAELWGALQRTNAGRSAVVHVRAPSGAGKSALVERFLDEVEGNAGARQRAEALVLRSRCYEREAMPFKALDSLMDALVRHLSRMDDLQVSHVLPADIEVLAQLFPVFERLRAVQRLLSMRKVGDGGQNRLRAEAALRDLISRVAARAPLVIWIDDLQWGDLDSASLLMGWLQQPLAVRLLLVFSYRSDEAETSPCLLQLLQPCGEGGAAAAAHDVVIDVAALAPADTTALCRERLGPYAGAHPILVERIVRESQGSPFWASQLAALAQAKIARGDSDADQVAIEDVVRQASALLPQEAKHLLAVLAVAGRPMLPRLALRAAGVRHGGRDLIHTLRGLRLVRTRDGVGERLLEVYHDRVRVSVQRALSAAELERVHVSLLSALEHGGCGDPDWLHALALGASQPLAALRYGLLAAERARATLAFERAAELYRSCLQLISEDAPSRGELLRKLATVLGQSGKGAQAAAAQLEAARLAAPDEAIALMRSAAMHLLRSGRFAEGEALLGQVFTAMDIDVPEGEGALTAAIVWERCRLRMRGFEYTRRSESQVPAALLARIDLCESLRSVLLETDALRSALLQTRGARWALEAGEPARVARALCGAATDAAVSQSGDAARRTDELLAMAERIADEVGRPATRASVLSARALAEFILGRMARVIEPSYAAERLLRTLANDSDDSGYHARLGVVSARIGAFLMLGDYPRFLSELRAAVAEAKAADNRTALLQLALNETVADEVEARTGEALARLVQQRAQLPTERFAILHVLHMAAIARITCNTQRYDWGLPLFAADWERFRRSPMRRSSLLMGLAHGMRARLLLNVHVARPSRDDPGRLIAADLKALMRRAEASPRSFARSEALALRARTCFLQGRRELAVEHMQAAVRLGDEGLAVDASVHRYALGLLLGGAEGARIRAEAERAMRASGIVDPYAYARSHYPELVP